MTNPVILLISVAVALFCVILWLEKELTNSRNKIEYWKGETEDWKSEAEEFESKWKDAVDEHLRDMREFKETHISKQESLAIKSNNETLAREYAKLDRENDILKDQLDNANHLLDNYRAYCSDILILGLEHKPPKTPIWTPTFIKEENPDD